MEHKDKEDIVHGAQIDNKDEPDDDDKEKETQYNLRGNKRNYGFRLANRMNINNIKKSYGVQFSQVHTATKLDDIKTEIRYKRDYTASFVKEVIEKSDVSSNDLMSFVTQ